MLTPFSADEVSLKLRRTQYHISTNCTYDDTNYRFGFNGKEHDPELKGKHNVQDYGFRMNDTRYGRFFTVDPLSAKFPHYSPYHFAGNTPIQAIDIEGLEESHYTMYLDKMYENPKKAEEVNAAHKQVGSLIGMFIIGSLEAVFAPLNAISEAHQSDNLRRLGQTKKAAVHEKLANKSAKETIINYGTGVALSRVFKGITMLFKAPVEKSVTMYRVQGGGVLPNVSKERILLNESGIKITGDDMLYVNFGQKDRALEFLVKRGEQAYVIQAEVTEEFVNKVRSSSVIQSEGGLFPSSPQKVDPSKAIDQYGLPKEWFGELEKSIVPKSAKKVDNKSFQQSNK